MKKTTKIVSDLVKFPSITPFGKDKKEEDKRFEACMEALSYIENLLKESGAKTQKLVFEGGHHKWAYPVPNLYSQISFGDCNAKDHKFICYMGHIDVVPVGDEALWSKDPFSGEVEGGYIHGRGATDMKGSVGAWINCLEEIKESISENQNITIGTIITGDEEWAAINGSDKVLEWLKENKKTPDAFIVGEPSSSDFLGTNIKIGRRGSLVGYIDASGVQGHRAYDDLFKNPNRALAYAMVILNQKKYKDGNQYFPDTTFEIIAQSSGDFNASSIIPSEARAMWNVRYTDKQNKEKILKDLQELIQNPPSYLKKHPDFEVAKQVIISANLDTASMPYYCEPQELANSAKQAIKDILEVDASFDGFGGTTDGRFIHRYFPKAQIIELGTTEKGGIIDKNKPSDYEKKGGMHQVDERVSQDDVYNLSKIYTQTLHNYSKVGGR